MREILPAPGFLLACIRSQALKQTLSSVYIEHLFVNLRLVLPLSDSLMVFAELIKEVLQDTLNHTYCTHATIAGSATSLLSR